MGITSRYYLSLACGNAFDTTNSNATKHEVSLVFLKGILSENLNFVHLLVILL